MFSVHILFFQDHIKITDIQPVFPGRKHVGLIVVADMQHLSCPYFPAKHLKQAAVRLGNTIFTGYQQLFPALEPAVMENPGKGFPGKVHIRGDDPALPLSPHRFPKGRRDRVPMTKGKLCRQFGFHGFRIVVQIAVDFPKGHFPAAGTPVLFLPGPGFCRFPLLCKAGALQGVFHHRKYRRRFPDTAENQRIKQIKGHGFIGKKQCVRRLPLRATQPDLHARNIGKQTGFQTESPVPARYLLPSIPRRASSRITPR